jgi:Biotin carboxylase
MRQRILLVTTVQWPSAARLAGALVHLGAHVEAVFPKGHVLYFSRYLSRGHRYKPLDGAASIAKAITAAKPDRVVACDDRALALLLQLPQFTALLEYSFGPLDSIATLSARAPSMAAAAEAGIAAPRTLRVESLKALPSALEAVGLPCVVKSDFSWGGEGVKFVSTLREAEDAFRRLSGPVPPWRSLLRAVLRKDAHFLALARHPVRATVNVQARVTGHPATTVFAARDGKVLAAHHMDVLSSQGLTGPASIMARLDCPKMQEAAEKLAARFGLNGFHGLDFVRDSDGNPHLIEVNPRATQICHLALYADLPAAILGGAPRAPVTTSRQIALFPQLLWAGPLPAAIYQDIPFDDPGVLKAAAGEHWMETDGMAAFADLVRPGRAPKVVRKTA